MRCVVPMICILWMAGGVARADLDTAAIRTVTLQNGLTVILAPDSLAATVDVAVWYAAGPRFEPSGASGLTNLFGHLMFGGSRRFGAGEHRRRVVASGGTLNSITNADYTSFYQTLPSEALDMVLELEADRMGSLVLTARGFDAARQATLEARRRIETSPVARGVQDLYSSAYQGHPYARPVVGRAGDLERLTLEDAEAYHRARFSPHLATLTLVGRFDPSAALAMVKRRFAAIPRRATAPVPRAALPTQTDERRVFSLAPLVAPVLVVGWRVPGLASEDGPALDLIAQIVQGGASSRLRRLTEGRIDLIDVRGDFDRGREASMLFCVATVHGGADSSTAERALVSGVERLAEEPIDAEDLEAAKRQIELRTLLAWESSRGRAEAIGVAHLQEGDARAAFRRLEKIRALTSEALQSVAARVLRPSTRSVVWLMSSQGPPTPSSGEGGRP